MATNINTILDWFKTGKVPTQQQFWDSWQSFWHKDETIPQGQINGLTDALNGKAAQNDFAAHLIDVNAHADIRALMVKETYKPIDALITAGVYTVQADDFGKTLRYSGSSAVTILLSSTITYSLGNQFKIFQSGTGQVTFSTNGFILNHGSDETTKLYGAYSKAAVEITDTTTPAVFIYGKLQLV